MSKIDDIEAIRRLTYQHFWGWDVGDVDAAIDVFTTDAVNDQTEIGSFVLRGQEELRAHFNEWRPLMTHSFHMVGNHIIDFDDEDHAHGINCQDGVAVMAADGAHLAGKHYFEDTYVRTSDGWRIATRRAFGLMPPSA